MRETCARVLAAALMTGAIASVVAMSALLNTPRDDGYALTTPPSSLQRSVRVPALAAPPRPVRAERLVTALSVQTPVARPVVVKPAASQARARASRRAVAKGRTRTRDPMRARQPPRLHPYRPPRRPRPILRRKTKPSRRKITATATGRATGNRRTSAVRG